MPFFELDLQVPYSSMQPSTDFSSLALLPGLFHLEKGGVSPPKRRCKEKWLSLLLQKWRANF